MLSKLKDKLGNLGLQEKEQAKSRKVDISFLNQEQIKQLLTLIKQSCENLESLQEITVTNKTSVIQFIQYQQQNLLGDAAGTSSTNQEQENYTFQQDIDELKQVTKELTLQIQKVTDWIVEIKKRVNSLQIGQSTEKVKMLQQMIQKKQIQIVNLKKGQQNMKEILNTLTQQNKLYQTETKNLQQKMIKVEKQLNQKTTLFNNLKQEKQYLLQLRNTNNGPNPEVQALKQQLSQFDKRLQLQKTRNQLKQKQIQNLKKKLQQDRQSLQKIADQLKQKQLKSKKILDKYQRSKVQIRKFRQQKNDFIKKLNIEVASLSQANSEMTKTITGLKAQQIQLTNKIQQLQGKLSSTESKTIQLQQVKMQLSEIRKQMITKHEQVQQQKQQNQQLKQANEQLQAKRRQLLQALQKPVNSQVKVLEKISRAVDKLYKEYITVVFEEGNVVGFENRIMGLKSNIDQIKEDLLL